VSPVQFKLGRRARARRPSPTGVYIRLGLMVTVLVVLLAVILSPGLLYRAGLPREQPTRTRPARADVPPGTVRIITRSMPASRPAPVLTQPARPSTQAVGLPLGIDRAILNDVQDLQEVETGPYFAALKAVSALPTAAFEQPGLPEGALADLLEKSARFRGQLVKIRGSLRRLERWPLGANEADIDHVFVAQVRDALSVKHIYALVLVEDPKAEIVVGRDVSFTGIFFKVAVGRDATRTLRQSPLLIGRSLRLVEPAYPEQYKVPIALGAAVGVLLIVLVVVAVVFFRHGDRKFARRYLTPAREPPPGFDPLPPADEAPDGDEPRIEEPGDGDDQS